MLQRARTGIKKEGWERSDVHFCCSLRDDIYLTHIDLPPPHSPHACYTHAYRLLLRSQNSQKRDLESTAPSWLSNMFSEVTLPKH